MWVRAQNNNNKNNISNKNINKNKTTHTHYKQRPVVNVNEMKLIKSEIKGL